MSRIHVITFVAAPLLAVACSDVTGISMEYTSNRLHPTTHTKLLNEPQCLSMNRYDRLPAEQVVRAVLCG